MLSQTTATAKPLGTDSSCFPNFLQDQLADWLDSYVKLMNVNFWGSSTAESATFNEEAAEWTVTVESNAGGKSIQLRPKHLVFSTGMYGDPVVPDCEGSATFQGLQYHSSQHRADAAVFEGKRCLVVGSNTSAHDMCFDLCARGAAVTMLQRSPTLVISTKTAFDVYVAPVYGIVSQCMK